MAPSGFSISSAAFAQDQLYTNGGLNYSLRGYGTIGSNQQNSGAAQTNGEELLSVQFNHTVWLFNAVYSKQRGIKTLLMQPKGSFMQITERQHIFTHVSLLLGRLNFYNIQLFFFRSISIERCPNKILRYCFLVREIAGQSFAIIW